MKLSGFFSRLLHLMAGVVFVWPWTLFSQLEATEDNLKPSAFQLKKQEEAIRNFKDARNLFLLGRTEKERAEALKIFEKISGFLPNKALPSLNYVISISALSVGDFEKARKTLILSGDLSSQSRLFEPKSLKSYGSSNSLTAAVVAFTDLSSSESGVTSIIGSGATISEDGWILTAAHVIASCEKPGVYLSDGRRFPITRLVPGSFNADIALAKIDTKTPVFVTLADNPPVPGDDLFSLGFPLGCFVPVQGIGNYKKDYIYFGPKVYATTIPVLPGNSGSAVFNQQGKVVGVAILGEGGQAIEYSGTTPLEEIRSLILARDKGESFPVEMKDDWEEKSLAWSFNDSSRRDLFNKAITEMLESPEAGIRIMKKSKESGDRRAFLWLGFYYLLLPNASEKDKVLAYNFFEEGKDLSPDCMAVMGWLKTQGIGTRQDEKEGWRVIQEASEKGSAYAFNRLALRYLGGHGVPADYAKAIEYAEQAIALGDEFAMTEKLLALQADFVSNGTNKPINEVIEEIGRKKDFELVDLSKEKATRLFEFALYASQFEAPFADHFLAIQYLGGVGTERDIGKAIFHFTKSAQMFGLEVSAVELAKIYLLGKDVPADYEKTRFWTQEIAEKGNPGAKLYYAWAEIMPKNDIPGSRLSEKSLSYLRDAAEADIGYAQWLLADIYLTGGWVPKNAKKAVMLYESALRNGCPVEDELTKAKVELAKEN